MKNIPSNKQIEENNNSKGFLANIWADGEYRRLIYCIMWLIVCCYYTGLSNAIADNLAYNLIDSRKNTLIVDLGFEAVRKIFGPNWDIAINSHDITLYVTMIMTFLFVLIYGSGQRVIIFKRWILMFNILFTFRSLVISTTILPLPPYMQLSYTCAHWKNVFVAPFSMVEKNELSCHDFFFSGHTTNAIICALILSKYARYQQIKRRNSNSNNNNNNKNGLHDQDCYPMYYDIIFSFLIVSSWLLIIVLIVFLLYLQIHYTIDIITAIIFTIFVWVLLDYEVQLMKGCLGCWERPNDTNEFVNTVDTFGQSRLCLRSYHPNYEKDGITDDYNQDMYDPLQGNNLNAKVKSLPQNNTNADNTNENNNENVVLKVNDDVHDF